MKLSLLSVHDMDVRELGEKVRPLIGELLGLPLGGKDGTWLDDILGLSLGESDGPSLGKTLGR